ncbi:MAG: N-acetylneuraminate synthase [Betaproteobacteria bacterium]|nr:N-acetylneuraminate synthase [Betaproteobacteria bacterium]
MTQNRVFIIAEAGVNHNGSVEMALQLIDAAVAAGADAVKFQSFRSEKVISRHAAKASYQLETTGAGESQLEMVKKLELDFAAHQKLLAHCRARGIRFLSTPFDEPSVDLLVNELGVSLLKIPSGEITNALLLLKIAASHLPVILSTGMSSLGDIEAALGVLAYRWLGEKAPPTPQAFAAAYRSNAGQRFLRERVSLLHCTTEYPAPFDEVNLRVIDTLAQAFDLPTGYSDHTTGIAVPIAAVARGASIIEKHFTLDCDLPGPDHRASLEPDALRDMVAAIRQVASALGGSRKIVTKAEAKNQAIARKSLVAARAIAAGELFSLDNITAKRPGNGISPLFFHEFLGRPASRAYAEDEALREPLAASGSLQEEGAA